MTITICGNRINSKDIDACYVRKYKGEYYLTISVRGRSGGYKGFNGEFGLCSYKKEEDARNALSSLSKAINDSLSRKVSYKVDFYEITKIHT